MYKKTSIMKMKTFLKTNALAIMALLFAGSIMSFKIAEDNAILQPISIIAKMYLQELLPIPHWQTTNASECENEGERPCSIVVPEGQTLNSILSGKPMLRYS
jgi:hypothetical protein